MALFRGATAVRQGLKSFFQGKTPNYIDLAHQQWGIALPLPSQYLAYEPDGLVHRGGPVIAVSLQQSNRFTTVDIGPTGANEYRSRYSVRVYCWMFTPETATGEVPPNAQQLTIALRDDMAAVIRAMLLDNPALGNKNMFQLNEDSLSEEYSDVSPVPNVSGRFIAGTVHSFEVEVDEPLHAESIAVVPEEGVEIETELTTVYSAIVVDADLLLKKGGGLWA